MQEAFRTFDAGTGVLSSREAKYALRGLGYPVSKGEAAAVVARHARSGEAGLTQTEFEAAVRRLEEGQDPAAQLARLFGLVDADSKGHITPSDIQQVRAVPSCPCSSGQPLHRQHVQHRVLGLESPQLALRSRPPPPEPWVLDHVQLLPRDAHGSCAGG